MRITDYAPTVVIHIPLKALTPTSHLPVVNAELPLLSAI